MPGLNQLKQFNAFMLNLGDEVKIRQDRGEKPSLIGLPAGVEDRDDSEDFISGLPQLSEEEQQQADARAAEAERAKNDFSDFTGESGDEEETKAAPSEQKTPDVSDLLTPNADLSLDDIDLSDFEEPEKPKEPPKPKPVAIEDMDLDALLKSPPKPEPAPKAPPKPAPKTNGAVPAGVARPAAKPAPKAQAKVPPKPAKAPVEDLTPLTPYTDENAGDFGDDFDMSSANSDFEKVSSAAAINMNDLLPPELNEVPGEGAGDDNPLLADDFVLPDFDPNAKTTREKNEEEFGIPSSRPGKTVEDLPPEASLSGDQAASGDDFSFDAGSDLGIDLGSDSSFDTGSDLNFDSGNDTSFDSGSDMGIDLGSDLNFDAGNDSTFDAGSDLNFDSPAADAGGETGDSGDSSSDFDLDSNVGFDSSDAPDLSTSFNMDGDDFSATDFGGDFGSQDGSEINPEMEVPEGDDFTETFDTSGMEGLDFSGDNSSDESSDFEFGSSIGTEGDDDSLFSIPGFSDTTTADFSKAKEKVQTPDFSGAVEGDQKPKNTFTDNEYKRFQKNLESYPLNVRIAIEDLVVKNEFTDDAVFAILEKVYKKAPARQIASELEKMLDITLEVPRDFERRSAEEYEAYKKSLEYQLKNRIIPGAIVSTAAAILLFCIYMISNYFIIKPARANYLYKQGYALLEENQYPQALDSFTEALVYKVKKPWFYKYARGFREHRQYQRAANMYETILSFFDHEKQAGMEWAQMEMEDLYDYEETERVLKREVLDYHINDPEAILLLGDNYLEWATERDPSKFEDAKYQYDLLQEVGDSKLYSLYMSRQMRYYIRTDNLREVLGYKAYFYPINKKDGLTSKDLTELSGYLLDKLNSELKPAEEPLRFEIENVRELLEKAVQLDETNAVALYNLGRYFVSTDSINSVENLLKESIKQFENQDKRSRSETYKFINAYRLLGEEYRRQKEYILAEETYDNGIELYEKEHEESGFESDINVGKLYGDLADLDYFVSGDMDSALHNYTKAVENKNDNASTRYRIGYIEYTNKNYQKALWAFLKSHDFDSNDTHLLLALANTFSQSSDNYNARGYYDVLLNKLDALREQYGVLLPQVKAEHGDLVETYMRAANNDGVTLARIADMTGDSSMNGQAIAKLQESLRAWDALTRNQETMVRLKGSNLAEQNIRYITNPAAGYEPEIYPDIYKLMVNEEGF